MRAKKRMIANIGLRAAYGSGFAVLLDARQ